MLSASAAGTVRLPAPMGPSPGYFRSKEYKRRRRLPHETCSDPIAVGGTDDRTLTGCSSGEEDALVSKTPFPEFSEVDIAGDEISSDIFADYDATIVNFWNNAAGPCIAEMPELEELYQDFKERNINLIGVGTDSGESREQLDTAREILKEKGVTYHNISPDPEGDFYKDFVADISTYPTTYIVDSEGNIVGADIVGNVKKQLDTVETRLALITGQK